MRSPSYCSNKGPTWSALWRLAWAIAPVFSASNAPDINSATPFGTDLHAHYYFPNSQVVLDLATLSDAVYHLRGKVQSCENRTLYQLLLPPGVDCLFYSHDYSLGTQVLVVRSSLHRYVAVAYAGTDDWKTALTDGDILTSDFGRSTNVTQNDNIKNNYDSLHVPPGVRVHRGFNSAVFDSQYFPTLLNCISLARVGRNCDGDGVESARGVNGDAKISPPYELFTTGHSLGAADSVLLGAALHLANPNETIRNINFGCPKIGNIEWSFWIDSMQPDKGGQTYDDSGSNGSFSVFRFVNKIDLVPRLPDLAFSHAGHTLQMSVGGEIKAFYDHLGNEDLGYAGVPFGWEAAPYALLPGALENHISKHYIKYLTSYQPGQADSTSKNLSSSYYVSSFERVEVPPLLSVIAERIRRLSFW